MINLAKIEFVVPSVLNRGQGEKKIPLEASDLADAVREGIASGKPCVIDANIDGDLNPAGAGIWELPGMGRSKPGIGKQYVPD